MAIVKVAKSAKQVKPSFGIKPLHDKLIVEPAPIESKIGNIHLPDQAKKEPQLGEVLAIGDEVCSVRIGDQVYFARYAGSELTYEGAKYLLLEGGFIGGALLMDTYDKYRLQRKYSGKLNLDNPVHEAAIHLIAQGTPVEEISGIIKEMSLKDVQELLNDPIAQKRIEWIRSDKKERHTIPKTADEKIALATKRLSQMINNNSVPPKDRINACGKLLEWGIAERKALAATTPSSAPAQISEEFKKAFGEKDTERKTQ